MLVVQVVLSEKVKKSNLFVLDPLIEESPRCDRVGNEADGVAQDNLQIGSRKWYAGRFKTGPTCTEYATCFPLKIITIVTNTAYTLITDMRLQPSFQHTLEKNIHMTPSVPKVKVPSYSR